MPMDSESASLDQLADAPAYSADLFDDAALRHPFEHYRAIRDLGPIVALSHPRMLAVARYADVQRALRTPEILISGKGVGFNDVVNAPTDQPVTIRSDGERHRLLRSQVSKPLSPGEVRQHREVLKGLIVERIDTLLDGKTFDAVPTLARHLPLQAVSYLVGLPDKGRTNMLRWAAANFNTLGPLDRNGLVPADIQRDLDTRLESNAYLAKIERAELRSGSWASRLFDAVDGGKLSDAEARAAIAAYVFPSLDTTIYAKSNLLFNLARNPEQWERLRADPSLIPSAVLEGVRFSAVVRWFSRVAIAEYRAGEVHVPAGARVMLMYGSANRDERHYTDADRFDVARNPVDHLGWGTGPHMCVGMHLARIEMEVMLEALVERVATIEFGKAMFGTNALLYGIDSLPMQLAS